MEIYLERHDLSFWGEEGLQPEGKNSSQECLLIIILIRKKITNQIVGFSAMCLHLELDV